MVDIAEPLNSNWVTQAHLTSTKFTKVINMLDNMFHADQTFIQNFSSSQTSTANASSSAYTTRCVYM